MRWSWKIVALAFVLGCAGPAWGQLHEPEEIAPPILILPTEGDSEGREIELELRPDRWDGKVREVKSSDSLSISAVKPLGRHGRTFARWRHREGTDTVEAGLECSLFGRDRWRVSHKLSPTSDTSHESTRVSLGVEVTEATQLSLSRTSHPSYTELGSGLSYKTQTGLEWGAMLKARSLPGGDEGLLWRRPMIESNLRWSW